MNYQLTQAGTTLTNAALAGELNQNQVQVLSQVHPNVFEALAQLKHGTEVTSEEALKALIERGFAEEVTETETEETTETEVETEETTETEVEKALKKAANDRNYTPIHEARVITAMTAAEFQVELLELVELGKVKLSSVQDLSAFPEEYLEDAIKMDVGATIDFFYSIA
jgi:hypothetical protein